MGIFNAIGAIPRLTKAIDVGKPSERVRNSGRQRSAGARSCRKLCSSIRARVSRRSSPGRGLGAVEPCDQDAERFDALVLAAKTSRRQQVRRTWSTTVASGIR